MTTESSMRPQARVAGLVLVFASLAGAAEAPTNLDLATVRAIPVQHSGRWMPLDTLARDVVLEVTRTTTFEGADPVAVLLGWVIDPTAWTNHPLIPIRNAELRRELELPADREVFSYAELFNHRRLRTLIEERAGLPPDVKPDPLQTKAGDLGEKLVVLDSAFRGEVLRLLPGERDPNAPWRGVEALRAGQDGATVAARQAWTRLEQAFVGDDASGFSEASHQLAAALAAVPTAYRPTASLIETELHLNRLRPFRLSWQIMTAGAVLAAFSLTARTRWISGLVIAAIVLGFAVLSYGLYLRWQLAGRIPASNMYESLLFLGWGAGPMAVASMLLVRNRTVPLTVSAMGALALFLADVLPLDPFIRPIPPVLMDTIWMSIHVPVIMVAYFVLALAMGIAHAQLVVMAVAPSNQGRIEGIDRLHHWYMHVGSILLTAGIATGSMWAASSWGRYWGWDPKEVWSLIALVAYLTILHVRIDTQRLPAWTFVVGAVLSVGVLVLAAMRLAPLSGSIASVLAGAGAVLAFFVLVQGPFATAVKSVVAFWGIVMTYVGVNYVLGSGLHSYGFGTGAVQKYMFRLGAADLAFVCLCGLVYAARRGSRTPEPHRLRSKSARSAA